MLRSCVLGVRVLYTTRYLLEIGSHNQKGTHIFGGNIQYSRRGPKPDGPSLTQHTIRTERCGLRGKNHATLPDGVDRTHVSCPRDAETASIKVDTSYMRMIIHQLSDGAPVGVEKSTLFDTVVGP